MLARVRCFLFGSLCFAMGIVLLVATDPSPRAYVSAALVMGFGMLFLAMSFGRDEV